VDKVASKSVGFQKEKKIGFLHNINSLGKYFYQLSILRITEKLDITDQDVIISIAKVIKGKKLDWGNPIWSIIEES
jgi:hypothetical protein